MSTLLVCHSVGDTETLLDTARALRDRGESYQFLAVGQSASEKLTDKQESYIDCRFAEDRLMTSEEHHALRDLLEANLKDQDKNFNFDRVIVGAPSKYTDAPIEVADWYAEQLKQTEKPQPDEGQQYLKQLIREKVKIVNTFLFKDDKDITFEQLNEGQGRDDYHLMVPMKGSKIAFQAKNSNLLIDVVGHTSFDKAEHYNKETLQQKRDDLDISGDDQRLIFFAGSKDLANDKVTLEGLLCNLYNQNDHIKNYTQIRIGLHPGVDDKESYLNGLNQLISDYDMSDYVKIILNDRIRQGLSEQWLTDNLFNESSDLYIQQDLSSDEATKAADGMAAHVPASNIVMGAGSGVKAIYCPQGESSFLTNEATITANPNSFFESLAHSSSRLKTYDETPEEGQASTKKVGDNIADNTLASRPT